MQPLWDRERFAKDLRKGGSWELLFSTTPIYILVLPEVSHIFVLLEVSHVESGEFQRNVHVF